MAAISMPGVILSQLEMQISASAQCACTMYSTASAMSSRLGSEYSIPPWPIAMPSSTAMVLNSRGMAPAALIAPETTWPTSRRWTCPGTNSVKLFATATIGLPDVFAGDARGPHQGTGPRHVSAVRDSARPKRWHDRSSP